ncbi:c-type cytochrome biogenesis protein CcsB [bacterium]|nr:c-type cytochrome biogenesis protein CcsB [bacterium]
MKKGMARMGQAFTIAGFVLHTAAILTRYAEAGHLPVISLYESLSFFAWATILVFLICDYRSHIPSLGSFVLPLTSISLIYTLALPSHIEPLNPALQSAWRGIHTISAFLGYGAFAVAFCAAIIYLLQERQLKRKKPGALYYRLPSLETLDFLSHKVLAFGFPCLTIAIITGSMWASSAWGSYWSWDPKETWSLITWFVYAAMIHTRVAAGWRGKKASYLAIIGFLFVMFTFLGVSLLLKGLHTYG